MQDVPVRVEVVFDDDFQRMIVTQGARTPRVFERYVPASQTETELHAFIGTYVSDEGLADLRVSREGEMLIMHVLHADLLPLRPLSGDRFAFDLGGIEFDRSGGRVTGLTLDMGHILGVRFSKRD